MFLELQEKCWNNDITKNWPHYKHVLRPLYKLFGGSDNPLVSVPLTFAVADLLFHRPFNTLLICNVYNDECPEDLIKQQIYGFLSWMLLSLPVAYSKYQKNKQYTKDMTNYEISSSSAAFFTNSNRKTNDNDDNVEERDYRKNPRRSERLKQQGSSVTLPFKK